MTMPLWVALVPLLAAAAIAAGLGVWLDHRRGSREVLLHEDRARARATIAYYADVQDSISG